MKTRLLPQIIAPANTWTPLFSITKKARNIEYCYRRFLGCIFRSCGHPLTWPSMTRQKNTPSPSSGGRSRRARVSAGPPWVPMTSADPEDRKREESALRGSYLGQRSRICFIAVAMTSCIFEKFSQKLRSLDLTRPVQPRDHTRLWTRTKHERL